jgi:hypothetical protein
VENLRWLLAGWTRASAVAIVAVVLGYAAVAWTWREYLHPELGMDWLLAGIWAFMTLLLAWRLDVRRDLRLVLVGLAGGAVIEWWGTTTSLWTYFTRERPPLWIIPAWPVAALTIHRMPLLLGRFVPGLWRAGRAYGVLLLAFCVGMGAFAWPSAGIVSTQVVFVLIGGVALLGADPDVDTAIFLAGSFLGVFLEYWGTSRHVWNYYTHEVPPPAAVFAHGFASVAFARAERVVAAMIPAGWRGAPTPRDSR